MTVPVAIQPFHNLTSGPLDLFTGVFYIMRVLSLGHGSIQPSTEDTGILEQNIYNPNPVDDTNLWYFEPASSPGLYHWKSLSHNATVMWDATEEDEGPSESQVEHNDEDKSYPLILENLSDGLNPEENPLVSSLWTLQPHALHEFGLSGGGTGYSLKSFNPSHTPGSVTLGSENTKGWWLQVDEQNPAAGEGEECNAECFRSKSNTIMIFEPTSFKLHADTNHMDLGEYSDILKQVEIRKQHLSSKVTLYNPSEVEKSFNVSLDTIVEYDVFTEPQREFHRMFSSLTVFNPLTNPSMKYFNFEEGAGSNGGDYNGKAIRLKASAYVKSVEEVEVEAFTTKKVSGVVTYIEEFGGIPYSSWTNVSAQIDTKGKDQEVTLRWVTNSDLLQHLVRSRGYQGQMKEVQTSPGEPAKIAIKIRGTIRGRLPLPYIQFEEVSVSPYSVGPTDPPQQQQPPQDDNRVKPYSSSPSNPNLVNKNILMGKKFDSHLS